MDNRNERIVVETDRHRIVGNVMLPREGYQSRLSDYLNRSDVDFVALTDAVIAPLDRSSSERREFIAVGRRHIQLVYPEDGAGRPT